MPGPRAVAIHLSDRQRRVLEEIARRPKSPQRLARRATILIQAADRVSNDAMIRDLKLNQATVRCWRGRGPEILKRVGEMERALEAEGTPEAKIETVVRRALEEGLEDAPRPGTPVKFSAEQICGIIALACEEPEKYGRPVTHWTKSELADEAVKQEIVPQISVRSVGRFLKGVRPQAASKPVLVESADRGRGGVSRGGEGRLRGVSGCSAAS